MKRVIAVAITLSLCFGVATAPAHARVSVEDEAPGERPEPDFEGALEVLTEELSLSEEQAGQVNGAMAAYGASIQGLSDRSADDDADPKAMIGELKKARAAFRKQLESILSKEQYAKFEQLVDQTMREMMSDLAEIKLMDLQEPLKLTDEQIEKLAPPLGDSMLKMVRLLVENTDKRLGPPKKIKLAKALKKIKGEADAAMKAVLSPEQLKALEELRSKKS